MLRWKTSHALGHAEKAPFLTASNVLRTFSGSRALYSTCSFTISAQPQVPEPAAAPATPASYAPDIETVPPHHRKTKHSFQKYADRPHALDWANRPNAFCRHLGLSHAPLRHHPISTSSLDQMAYPQALTGFIDVQIPTKAAVSLLLYDGYAESAWKKPGELWSQRMNPGSGKLLPTELLEKLTIQLSCFQKIGRSGCFSVAIVARLDDFKEKGGWMYPGLRWDWGYLRQLLCRAVHACGVLAAGLGSYFDDPGHGMHIVDEGLLASPFTNIGIFTRTVGMNCGSSHTNQARSCRLPLHGTSKLETKPHAREGCRQFSSVQDFQEAFEFSSVMEQNETKGNDVLVENENYDFRNFPALQSTFFEDYKRPQEMLSMTKHVPWKWKHRSFRAEENLTLDSIPKPKGRVYDFGFGDQAINPPPLKAGARPQGRFDIDYFFNESEVEEEGSSVSGHSQFLPDLSLCVGPSKDAHFMKDGDSQGSIESTYDDKGHADGELEGQEDWLSDSELWDPHNLIE